MVNISPIPSMYCCVPIGAIQTISKVWPTRPSSGLVSVYVRLPSR